MQLGHFKDERSEAVHDRTDGSEVVKRDERIHLVLRRAQKPLDHDQSDGLKQDPGSLEEESDKNELDLSKGCDHDADDDE